MFEISNWHVDSSWASWISLGDSLRSAPAYFLMVTAYGFGLSGAGSPSSSTTRAVLTRPDADAYADGIGRLLEDPELGRQLSDRGRRLIDETYNFGEFKRRLGACYEAIAGESTEADREPE